MTSVFDIFKSAPAQAPTQAPTPGNLPAGTQVATATNDKMAPNGVVPVTPPAPKEEPKTPLDEFKSLWDTKPVEAEGSVSKEPAPLTAEDIQKAVANADFSSNISPDLFSAISEGGDKAQQAFAQAMNTVAQQVMVQSTLVNNKLTEKAVADAAAKYEAALPQLLRSQAATDHLKSSNPVFSDPAVKPVIDATKEQLLNRFPNATNSEITDMTQKYIIAMGKAFAPAEPKKSVSDAGTNWEKFLAP